MPVVYIHRRNDTSEVFYVGIGLEEERSRSHYNRTKHWHRIVDKVGYAIEVTHTDIIWEEACSIERYLISFYGRRDLGEGTLVNLTNGGEGVPGMKHSQATKDLISEQNKTPGRRAIAMENLKKMQTPEARAKALKNRDYSFASDPEFIKRRVANTDYKAMYDKIDTKSRAKNLRIPVIQYDLNMVIIKEWESGIEAARQLGLGYKSISLCLRGKQSSYKGYVWKYKDIEISVKDHDKHRAISMMKPVLQYDKNGVFIKEWESSLLASFRLNIDRTSIGKCCNGKRPSAGGYVWKNKISITN